MRYLLLVMIIAFFASGLFFLGVSGRELLRKLASRSRFERADGVVMNVHRKRMRSTNQHRYKPTILNFPVIRFTTQAGDAITFTSETGDSGKTSRYSPGKRVPVRYDPHGEFPPMIDSWSGVWLPALMALLAGAGFILGAILIVIAFGNRILGG